jgi:hypothetical protein
MKSSITLCSVPTTYIVDPCRGACSSNPWHLSSVVSVREFIQRLGEISADKCEG